MANTLQLRDRNRTDQRVEGYSPDNMLRRMFGRGAYALEGNVRDEPLTVCKPDKWAGGRVIGSAIFHSI